jgi:hypothetical protein
MKEWLLSALNMTYQLALKTVTSGYTTRDVQNLREAEKMWIAYRDAACKAEYGLWGGGSGGPDANTMCLVRLTRQRTAELKSDIGGAGPVGTLHILGAYKIRQLTAVMDRNLPGGIERMLLRLGGGALGRGRGARQQAKENERPAAPHAESKSRDFHL